MSRQIISEDLDMKVAFLRFLPKEITAYHIFFQNWLLLVLNIHQINRKRLHANKGVGMLSEWT